MGGFFMGDLIMKPPIPGNEAWGAGNLLGAFPRCGFDIICPLI
jgi:hypothetical protein